MLSDMFAELIQAKTPEEREKAFRNLEKVGVDRATAIAVAEEMTRK